MDTERFDAIRDRIMHEKRARAGIGTYQEKTVHAILKDYYAPDPSMQEIPVAGYIADIFTVLGWVLVVAVFSYFTVTEWQKKEKK